MAEQLVKDFVPVAQGKTTLQDILKLTHIPGPVVFAKFGDHTVSRYIDASGLKLVGVFIDEMFDQRWDILRPLPQ